MDYSLSNFQSWSGELSGPSTKVTDIPIGAKILHVDILQSGTASNSLFNCGGLVLAKNYARDSETELAFTSTTTCSISKTGTDDSFFAIIYSTGTPAYPVTFNTNNTLSIDGQAFVYVSGIVLFISMLYFFRDIFNIEKYD